MQDIKLPCKLLDNLQTTPKYEFISFRSFSDCLGWPVIATRGVKIRPLAYGPDFCQGDLLGEPSPSATSATLHGTYTFWNRRLLVVIYLVGS